MDGSLIGMVLEGRQSSLCECLAGASVDFPLASIRSTTGWTPWMKLASS